MAYEISGTKSETARVFVINESDWSVEYNSVISGSGAYSVTTTSGEKTVFGRVSDGQVIGYGSVTPYDDSSEGGSPPASGPEPPATGTWVDYTAASADGDCGAAECFYRLDASYNPNTAKLGIVYPTADGNQDTVYKEGISGSYGSEAFITNYYEMLRLIHDSSGKAHASWQWDGHIYYSTNTTGSWVTVEVASCYAVDDPDFGTNIALDSNGKIWIAYGAYETDVADDTGLYVVTNATGSWVAERAIPTNAEVVSGNIGLEIDSSNVKHMTYYDYNQNIFRYAWGTTGSWSSEDIPTGVTVASPSGERVDMTIDSNSKIHLAFFGREILSGSGAKGDPYVFANRIGHLTNSSGSWVQTLITGSAPLTNDLYELSRVEILCGGGDSIYIISSHLNGNFGGALNFVTNKSGSWVSTNIDSSTADYAFMGADIYGTKIYMANITWTSGSPTASTITEWVYG